MTISYKKFNCPNSLRTINMFIDECIVHIIKKRNNLFAMSLLVVVVANYLSKKLPASIKVFSPFTYLSTDTLADQSIRIYKAMPNSSYLMGIGVIIIWSLIFYILGIVFLSMKKDQI